MGGGTRSKISPKVERAAPAGKPTGDNSTPQARAGKPGEAGPARRRRGNPETAGSLEAAALAYIARYASSRARLERLLVARIERSRRRHGAAAALGRGEVEALILRLERAGLIDDARYAEHKAAHLRRRGTSGRRLGAELAARGLDSEPIAAVFSREGRKMRDGELAAALNLARRRRLGPFRPHADRPAHREKDLAALGRAGFDYAIARRVIELEGPDAALGLIAEATAPPDS